MFIKDTINFIKYKRIIKDVLKEEDLLNNLSKVFSSKNHTVKFRTDWIGRTDARKTQCTCHYGTICA